MYDKKSIREVEKYERLTIENVKKFPYCAIKSRGITKETCTILGIRTELSETDGRTPVAHYFPFLDGKKKLVGYKRRDLTKKKKQRGHFTVVGEVELGEVQLFNQYNCQQSGRNLYITEGEYDCASVYQALYDNQKDPGKYNPNVVSISHGTATASEAVQYQMEFVNRYDVIISMMDNDYCTDKELNKGIKKGREAAADLALLIPDLKEIMFDDYKDANEFLVEEGSEELSYALFKGIKSYQPEGVTSGGGSVDDLLEGIAQGISLRSLPDLDGLLHGWRPGEVTIVLAPPKSGKTTLCKLMNMDLLQQKVPTLGCYLEEKLKKTRQSFVAMDNNVHLPKFRAKPSILKREQIEKSVTDLLDPEIAMFGTSASGKVTPEGLMNMLQHGYNGGAKVAFVDHLSFVLSGSGNTKSEREAIDHLMHEIAAFATATDMHIVVVVHVTIDKKRGKTYGEDGKVQYPYWYEVDEYDGRGSGAFAQLCDNLIAIDKEILEDKTRGRTRLNLLLNREWDWTGRADTLTMNQQTGRLHADTEEY